MTAFPAVVQYIGAANDTVNNTTVAVPYTNTPTVGNHLIAFGTQVNVDVLVSVSDTVNTWQVDHGGVSVDIWLASCLVTADSTGKTATFTLTNADTNKEAHIFEVSGLAKAGWFLTSKQVAVFFNGTSRNVAANTVAGSKVNDLILGLYAVVGLGNETSFTAGAGYTAIPGITGSGYHSVAQAFSEGHWRLLPSLTALEPVATGGTSPTAYNAIEAVYVADPALPAFVPHRMPLGV